MDLRTIRERNRQKKYQMTSDFLEDVNQIYENSVIFNCTIYFETIGIFSIFSTFPNNKLFSVQLPSL